jgi:HK97 family phage major capsid protein
MHTTFNINDARKQRHETKEVAKAMLEGAIARGKDLNGEEQIKYNALKAQIENLSSKIERHEQNLPQLDDNAPVVAPYGLTEGRSVQEHKPSGSLSARIRAAYTSASSDVRDQLDNFRAYIGGDIQAAANLTPAGDGAVIIPSIIFDGMERAYTEFSPVESVSKIWKTDTGADAVYPVLSDTETAEQLDAAADTGADSTVSGDTPPTSLTGPTMKAYKVSSKPVFLPRETGTDAAIDIMGEIILALYARIARFENLKYTKGTGTNEAEGFLKNATKLVTGSVALDLDICLDLAYNVPQLYRSGGVFQMTDTTAKYLRKLKTGIDGDKRQLWADADATKGTPATLHGFPVVVNNDMDSVAADGTFTGNPVVFGNFSKFVVRQAEQGRTFIRRYEVPAKDGSAVILFRRSDSKLIVPAAVSKVAVS